MYPPPKNGALVCMNREDGSQAFCQVACESGSDFVFHPPLIYACDSSGHWVAYSHFPQSNLKAPWPDCASMIVAIIYYNPPGVVLCKCLGVGVGVPLGY